MTNTMNNAAEMIEVVTHPFEKAGLGKAPFRYLGCTESKIVDYPGATPRPGTTCDFCGTAIMGVFFVGSADGKRFKVGCDCIAKTERKDNTADRKFCTAVEMEVKKRRNAMARERNAAKGAAATSELLAMLAEAEVIAKFSAMPHPNDYFAKQGKTYLDYANYMVNACGTSGRLALVKGMRAKLGR